MGMTKSDLIEKLCQLQKLPKGRAELLVNCIFQCMEDSLKRGERIEIRGFGSFEIRNYKAYEGRNPRTGSTVTVRPKRLPFFKVGKELKDRVNQGATGGSSNGAGSNGVNGANGHGGGSHESSGHARDHGPLTNGSAAGSNGVPAAAAGSSDAAETGYASARGSSGEQD
jgi:integration host factor subunit beta